MKPQRKRVLQQWVFVLPNIVCMQFILEQGTPLVQCTLETKPLKLKADYAVTLKVEPIEATYDSVSIDAHMYF